MGIIEHNTDILIVGAGLAGLQAAITITKEKPELHITLADLGGGASSEIMGFCAPLAPGDSAETFADDTLKAGGGESDHVLVRHLIHNAVSIVKSLEKLGIKFDRDSNGDYDLLRPVGSSFPRVIHHKTTSGKVIIAKYREILLQNPNVTFRKSRIIKLFTDNGCISGALGFENNKAVAYNTGRVILASGGAAGLFGFSTWTKILRGSGYALALDAGAELRGMSNIQFEPCVTVFPKKLYGFPIITTLLFEGAKLLDKDMQLITTKVPPKRELAEIIAKTVANGNGCKHGGVWFDFSGVNEAIFQCKYPEYYRKLRPFTDTFKDLKFEVKPAVQTTLGGIKIDKNGATAIRGLFAAGEVTGGIHGRDRIGGNAGLEVLVFGETAGLSAATCLSSKNNNVVKLCEESLCEFSAGNGNMQDYIDKIGKILDMNCSIIPVAQKLNQGRVMLKKLRSKFESNQPASIEKRLLCRQAFIVAEILLSQKTSLCQ